MVRKTRSSAIKTAEKIKKESPRRTRRQRSSSKSGDSDEEVTLKKDHCANQSEKGSSGNESDTDSKKPLKKRNISIALSSPKKINSDTKSSNKGDQQQDEGEEVKAPKGKSKSNSKSNNDGCKPEIESENVQVTDESPNDENGGNIASDELSKNGTETSEIDVNISQNIVAEMTCDNQPSEITSEEPSEIVAIQANVDENLTQPKSEEVEQQTKEVPPKSIRLSRFSDGPTGEGVANKSAPPDSPKKIKLNRLPRDKNKDETKDDKEVKKKLITLKRPEMKQGSLEDPNKQQQEQQETQESLPKEEDEWGSTYELSSEEKDEKSSRRKITLKCLTSEEKKDKKEVGRSVSLQETRERRTSTSADNIVINERRRHSTGVEKTASECEEKPQKPTKPTKVVKLIRTLPTEPVEPPPPGEQVPKKYKWSDSEVSHTPIEPLNLETLQELCPTIEFLDETDVDLEIDARERKSLEKAKGKTFLELEEEEMENIEAELNAEPEKVADVKENIIAMNRKISIVEDTASKLKPPPSPAKNPVSDVLFITNLVRPFTVKQLKELLERTGRIREDGFWTDKIKSKCYVQYETVEQAESTRNALHGVHWPIGNGKKLIIDYATVQDMENAKNPPIVVAKKKSPEKENKKPEILEEKLERRDVGATKREWDVGKENDHRRRRSRSKSRERRERKHSRRSYTPEDHHNKKRKHEEPPPQKAMDDLFLKTKATPSIYWQPLSPEEIAHKQQQRQARLEENKRRLEEIRSSGRGAPRDRSGRDRNFRRR